MKLLATLQSLGLLALVMVSPLRAEESEPVESDAVQEKGIQMGQEQVHRFQVGMKITAGGTCRGILATIPVPIDWPEQQVSVLQEDFSVQVTRVNYRVLDGGVKQMLIQIPSLRAGDSAHALVTYEIRRKAILAPPDPTVFSIPEQVERDLRLYLGSSPYIETRHLQIRRLANEVVAEKETAWEQVEAIYDTVREKVQYREGPLKGALAALRDGTGDCEELTSLFVAMCRANRIPARMVWVTDHCYPEFYLIDDQGTGHWIPCQAAGTRAFGSMPEMRPILQKGDNFRVPEKRGQQRYVAEFLKVNSIRGGGEPQVEFVRRFVQPE